MSSKKAGFGTLYVLSDDTVRIRDSVTVISLARFFEANNVNITIHPIAAEHRRFLSALNIVKTIKDLPEKEETALEEEIRALSGSIRDESFEKFIYRLFSHRRRLSTRSRGRRPGRDRAGARS